MATTAAAANGRHLSLALTERLKFSADQTPVPRHEDMPRGAERGSSGAEKHDAKAKQPPGID